MNNIVDLSWLENVILTHKENFSETLRYLTSVMFNRNFAATEARDWGDTETTISFCPSGLPSYIKKNKKEFLKFEHLYLLQDHKPLFSLHKTVLNL